MLDLTRYKGHTEGEWEENKILHDLVQHHDNQADIFLMLDAKELLVELIAERQKTQTLREALEDIAYTNGPYEVQMTAKQALAATEGGV